MDIVRNADGTLVVPVEPERQHADDESTDASSVGGNDEAPITEAAPETRLLQFFVLKMVLDYAIRDGNIRTNPCADVDLPSPRSPEMLFLTGAQVRALATAIDERWAALNAARTRPSEPAPYELLVETAAFTGLRAGELAALRMANLDVRAGTARVVSSVSIVRGSRVEGIPKTRAGRRTVVVNRALCERLRSHLGDRLLDREALVFTEPNGTPLKFGSFYSQRFKPAVRAVLPEHPPQAPVPRPPPHRRHPARRARGPPEGDGGAHGPLLRANHPRPAQPCDASHDLRIGRSHRQRLPKCRVGRSSERGKSHGGRPHRRTRRRAAGPRSRWCRRPVMSSTRRGPLGAPERTRSRTPFAPHENHSHPFRTPRIGSLAVAAGASRSASAILINSL